MKTYKTMVVTVILGLALIILPKVTWAADVSVGFFLGLPIPVVTFDPPRVYHAPPPVVVAPAPVYTGWYTYGHDNWRHDEFRHDDHGRFEKRNYSWEHRNDQNSHDRGWHNRGNDNGHWDRR